MAANAQPCGPSYKQVDQQYVTSDGYVLLTYTPSNLYTQKDLNGKKTCPLFLTVLNPEGEIQKDTLVILDWEGSSYDFDRCRAFYDISGPNYNSDKPPGCNLSLVYESELGWDMIYFLAGDPRNSYRIKVSKQGTIDWSTIDLEGKLPFYDDFSKFSYFDAILSEDTTLTSSFNYVPFQLLDDTTRVTFEGKSIEFIEDTTYRISPPPKFVIKNHWYAQVKRRKTALNGYLINPPFAPLVSFSGKYIYVTVLNTSERSCMLYPDILPEVYCLKAKNGKVKWSTRLH